MDSHSNDEDQKNTIDGDAGAPVIDGEPEGDPDSLQRNVKGQRVEEYSIQLEKKLKGPLARFTADVAEAERQEHSEVPPKPSCTAGTSDSCWNFECAKVPLETYGCNNGRLEEGKSSADKLTALNIGASIISAFGATPFHTHAGSDINLLDDPNKDDEPTSSASNEFIREDPNPTYVTAGPNPLRIPHDEIINAINGFTNMFLAHEIAINDNFELESYLPPPDSLESRVRAQMKRAFWDKFDQTFRGTPPNYRHALIILREIKMEMLAILLPHHTRIREQIETTLDINHIEMQIENRAFDPMDFHGYATFIIDILGNLCCPIRDPEIKTLREYKSGGRIFRGILETIEKMKMDMANFLISQSRPLIVKQCVHYERTKFAEFLELEYRLNDDGLKATRVWLLRHRAENRETRIVIAKALGELLNYDPNNPWPETLTLDIARLQEMGLQLKRLAIIGTCILSVSVIYQVMFGEKFVHDLRERSKKHLKLILTTEDMKDEKKTAEAILRIAEEMCSLINQLITEQLDRALTESERLKIRTCVTEVKEPDHKIHLLMLRRIYDYVDEVVCARWAYPVAMPPGIATIHFEVYGTLSQFYRLINHIRRVYGPIFKGIIEGELQPPVYAEQLNGQWDPKLCELVKELRKDFVEDESEVRARREEVRHVEQAQAQLPDGVA